MLVKGATLGEILQALDTANEEFDGNLQFNRYPEFVGHTRQGQPKYRLTLKVINSKSRGAKLGYHSHNGKQRHLINACWHAHGTFFDALPEGATIEVAGGQVISPGDPWEDRNIGSMMHPMYFSEACDC